MTSNQAFQVELRRLAFKSKLTPILAVIWLVGLLIVVGAWVAPQPWMTNTLDTLPWVVFGVLVGIGGTARRNVKKGIALSSDDP